MNSKWSRVISGLGLLALCTMVYASDYPNRPIQLMHGFGAGGNADVVARIVAAKMQEGLKNPVLVFLLHIQ